MRNKAIFSVFGRKLASGKRVFYYHCYDGKGNRQNAKSTGFTKKTEAMAYCMNLFKAGLLIPEQKKPTFAEFSQGWWDKETCQYFKWRQLHNPITDNTLLGHQGNFKHHISGYFAKYTLDEITPELIEGWLIHMSEKDSLKNVTKKARGNKAQKEQGTSNGEKPAVKPKKLLKANTINLALGTLKMMLGEAVRQKLLNVNPCNEVKELKEEKPQRIILTVEEAKKLFPPDWTTIWDNDIVYKAHLLGACTGVRIGELRGLRCEFVRDTCIYIKGQFDRHKYIDYTKTKENRTIPISPVMRQMLDDLLRANADGYVFSEDGGKTPITTDLINRGYNRALKKIGISYEEKIQRKLSFHSWRHFLNTLLRMSNVADSKVQAVTGHASKGMTDYYTHFDTSKFTEVMDVQTELLTCNDLKNSGMEEIDNMKAVDITSEHDIISNKKITDTKDIT